MLDQTKEFDPYASASAPEIRSFELYGKVDINAWAAALVKGQGKVPYDPAVHKSRVTAIDVFIDPLPELNITNMKACERHWIAESKEWASITLASIKAAGIENVREINGKWARLMSVPNGRTYEKKRDDGTTETKNETTFKFLEFFETEDACRAAYLANGGTVSDGHNSPAVVMEDPEKATAYSFLKVVVQNAATGKELDQAKTAVANAIAQYPPVAKFFTVDSEETQDLIAKFAKPPF